MRDATLAATGGEIAVRKGGPVLLGAGTYLRAMIDAAEGRTPTIRSSVAHTHLAREIGRAALRVTVVLTPEQRRTLDAELTGRASQQGGDGAPSAREVARRIERDEYAGHATHAARDGSASVDRQRHE